MKSPPKPVKLALLFLALILLAYQTEIPGKQENNEDTLAQDSTQARSWLQLARTLQDSSRHDSAAVWSRKAMLAYEQLAERTSDSLLWCLYLKAAIELGESLTAAGDLENSRSLFRESLERGTKIFGESHPEIARIHDQTGIILFKQGDFAGAAENHQRAIDILSSNLGPDHITTANPYSNLALVEQYSGNYQKALAYLERVLAIRLAAYGEIHTDVASSYNDIGSNYSYEGKYERALVYFLKAIDIWKQTSGENHLDAAFVYNNIGMNYWDLGNNKEAVVYLTKALEIFSEKLGPGHTYIGQVADNLGTVYRYLGRYREAIDEHQKAIEIFIQNFGRDHYLTATAYNNIGTVYLNQGDFSKALEFFQKSLAIHLTVYGPEHPYLGSIYDNIGITSDKMGNHGEAIQYYKKAQQIFQKNYRKDHPELAISYHNTGLALNELGMYVEAKAEIEKAIAINVKGLGPNHWAVADNYTSLGLIARKQKAYDASLAYFEKALHIRSEIFGAHHPETARSLNDIAVTYQLNGAYDTALDFFNRGMQALIPGFMAADEYSNPNISGDLSSPTKLLEILYAKSQTLKNRFEANPAALKDLYEAGETNQMAVSLLDTIRRGYRRLGTKTALQHFGFSVYEEGITICEKLFKHTGQDRFLLRAFNLFERSRAMLLLEGIREENARKFAGLPAELVDAEYGLERDLAFYEKSLYEERLKQSEADSNKIVQWQALIFELRQSHDSLMALIESRHPEYYRLKYDTRVVSVEDVQRLLPGAESALLEYFAGDRSIYVFAITKNDCQLVEIPRDFPLDTQVTRFLEYINSGNDVSTDRYQTRLDSMMRLANTLYRNIVAPVTEALELPERLIIVPDGVLGYLPFEALLRSPPPAEITLPEVDYLIRRHRISYCYSATLLKEMQEKEHAGARGDLLTFAPQFEPPDQASDSAFAQLLPGERQRRAIRAGLAPLRYNIAEAERISAVANGTGGKTKMFTGEKATRQEFLNHCADYSILHISSHADANDNKGDYSWIAFYQGDSTGQTLLYNRDLYTLQLKADLVVLSGCETGAGELKRGEGIIGLTRGFSYAGAKSLITSLWQVNDRSTSELMQHFYRELKAGRPKDAALRAAKLKLLASNEYADPFFWAAFIPIGDMTAIELGPEGGWIIWAGLGALVVASILFLFYRKAFR